MLYSLRLQQTIVQLREHVRLIQNQEEELMKKFAQKLGVHQSSEDEQPEIAKFNEHLEKIRTSRKHFKGLLYDAIVQRDAYLESFDLIAEKEREKEKQVCDKQSSILCSHDPSKM
jgi:hypothetical protein